MISKKLGSHFSYDFVDVIKINPMVVEPFDLKNNSLIFSSVNAVQSFFQNGFKPDENFVSKSFNKIYTVGATTKKRTPEIWIWYIQGYQTCEGTFRIHYRQQFKRKIYSFLRKPRARCSQQDLAAAEYFL